MTRTGLLQIRLLLACAIGASVLASGSGPARAQQAGSSQRPVFRAGVDLVFVNVVVRDRSGNPVRGLTREDFTVVEDGRRQDVTTFAFEELASEPMTPPPSLPTVLGSLGSAEAAASSAPPTAVDVRGRRPIAMLFDLTSMQPEELERAVGAAREYVERRLSAADLVAVVALSTSLQLVQDFTADRAALLGALDRMSGVEGAGFEEAATEIEAEVGFAADDSEFTTFNTDRRLEALKTLTGAMAGIEQKKSLIYFSSGMTQTGLDNRVAIREVIDRAVRANVSIYTADMRGLQAVVPGGDASQASVRGTAAFSGRSVSSRFDQMAASQDALSTLAEDTGGRAFFDENSFQAVFDRVVADTSAYYILGYSSDNRVKDGRFRRIRIQVRRSDVKLEYRAGYYAPRDFAHSGREDREQQLIEQLVSDLSVTDLPVYAASAYFRVKPDRYFVPVWVVVPGSRIPFARSRDKEKATLDVLAVLRDERQRPVGQVRDTVNLSVGTAEGVQQKSVQYQTEFELPPGVYRLKVVVRENQGGTLGSFETSVIVPNLARDAVKVSSVVIGTQLQPGPRRNDRNPLVRNGQQLVSNVAHVVRPGQRLYFYYEIYDPAPAAGAGGQEPSIRVLSNVVFFKGRQRVYDTPLVEARAVSAPDRKAAAFQLEVPAADLEPGLYTCQVNVVDDVGGTFAFPRLAVWVRR
jgi:VWFA-related protein